MLTVSIEVLASVSKPTHLLYIYSLTNMPDLRSEISRSETSFWNIERVLISTFLLITPVGVVVVSSEVKCEG